MPAGLFRSQDGGDSWQLMDSLWLDERRKGWMGGGNDHPGLHAICVDPRDSRHVTVAISCGGVWSTQDAGANWQLLGKGMHAPYMPPEAGNDPNIQDPNYGYSPTDGVNQHETQYVHSPLQGEPHANHEALGHDLTNDPMSAPPDFSSADALPSV